MAIKNWMAIHTFVSDEARREYCTPPREVATEKEWAAYGDSLPRAKCRQEWLGTDEFFFCHWQAESEEDIHAELADIGLDKLINTVCYEMYRFTSFYRNSDDKRVYPPLDVDDNAELAERVHQG